MYSEISLRRTRRKTECYSKRKISIMLVQISKRLSSSLKRKTLYDRNRVLVPSGGLEFHEIDFRQAFHETFHLGD